ncbi:MAG: DegT/DnrJ/EryC1/StrS aminotransferase family protein [Puniceicoccales bacterium]|jgi:dTDP-4-amino-4,6-dideoxygalactose transaminase|nr:DegT/DnrJ/EryC1/StrS aminotransferase family protein [Puniceicoccales bacterium]
MKRISYSRQSIDESDVQAVAETLKCDLLTQGSQITTFEEALKRYLNVDDVVVVSSGTAALHLSYLALNLRGTTVFTSPVTFAATANMLHSVGANVRFVDVDPKTGLMDVNNLEQVLKETAGDKSISKRAIVPVSLQGIPVNLPAIDNLAQYYGVSVVEDAAHSLGGEYVHDQQVYKSASCSHSDLAVLSFHPLKSICCAEGGAIATRDPDLAHTVRLLRNHGLMRQENSYLRTQKLWGYNYRMTDLQAALGVSQLKRLPFFLSKRKAIANRYYECFQGEPYCHFLTPTPKVLGSAYHLFVVHFESKEMRDAAYIFLQSHGIETHVHYVPLYKMELYKQWLGEFSLPGAEKYYQGCLSIPIYPDLSEEDQDYVLEILAKFCNQL